MSRFKKFFYAIYLMFFICLVLLGLNVENLVLHWTWDSIDTWASLTQVALKIGSVGIILSMLLFVVENIHLYTKDKKIKSLEADIKNLKSQMFDMENKKPTETEMALKPPQSNEDNI